MTPTAKKPAKPPARWILVQKPMTRVLLAATPAALAGIYLFGWRALAMLVTVAATALVCEGAFTWRQKKPASSAVFVTAMLLVLTLPPRLPLWMAMAGVVMAVVFGKMAFGGFGMNVFNPAMVGRCFLYICFPAFMTTGWALPANDGLPPAALATWQVDATTQATPLDAYKEIQQQRAAGKDVPDISRVKLFLGNSGGCLGETSALLVALGGLYLVIRRVASWQIVAGCLFGGLVTAAILHRVDPAMVGGPLFQLLAGGFLFGAFFIETDPVSAAKTPTGKVVYGLLIGSLTVVLRGYSNFSCGLMFAVLIANMFAPLIDAGVKEYQARRKAARAAVGGAAEGTA